jgi:hypothetical protein
MFKSVLTMEERFWMKVDRREEDECWEWTAYRNAWNYGTFGCDDARGAPTMALAHRVSYELHKGPIPEGLVIRHKCDNPPYVNPNHLELGTGKDNTRDSVNRKRFAIGERHPHAKLTDDKVREIKKLLAGGVSGLSIAKQFSVSGRSISDIKLNRSWKHLLSDDSSVDSANY